MSKVIGAEELIAKLGALGAAATGEQLRQALMAGGFVLETAVKASMREPKSGHAYGKHRASAPGEAPAVDTSNLINSIETAAESDNRVLVGTNAEYAEPLEFGTARMQARPFLRPAAEQNVDKIENAVKKILKQAIEGAI